ncbi:hypothetical protein ABXT72_00710 [Candidatus Pelagibacter sp. Uisw_094]|uniref:hypothetical protein n=1 Tax=Candidatus Pelagibacter sp. Uisw_094 TaxID=3230980 RepID=UPI0039EBD854
MLNFKDLNTKKIKNSYLYFLTFYSVSLSYATFLDIPTRYLVYSLVFFLLFNLKKFIIKNILISCIFIILIFHLLIQNPSNTAIISLFLSFFLFILVFENINFFKKNLIKIFYYSFFFVTIYLILGFCLDQNIVDQYSYRDRWGRNFFELSYGSCQGLLLNESKLFFSETSHIAISYVTLFGSFLFYEKNFKIKIIFTLIYSIICLMIFSITIWIGNIILSLLFIFFYSKDLLKEKFLIFLPLIILTIFVSLYPEKCLEKIYELKSNIKEENFQNLFEKSTSDSFTSKIKLKYNRNNAKKIISDQESKIKVKKKRNAYADTKEYKALLNKELEKVGKEIEELSLKKKLNLLLKVDSMYDEIIGVKEFINPTSFAFKFHVHLVLKNLKENPFGKGFNNYEKNYKILETHKVNTLGRQKGFINLNYNDGSSNGIKLLGEFGLILIVPLLIFFNFLISKSIDRKLKIICLSLVIIQLFRGAGYFNSGFILIGFIIICLSIKSKNIFLKKDI